MMEFCFYLITDRKSLPKGRTIEQTLEAAFTAGVKGVLLREKDLPDKELLALAQRVRDLTLRHGVKMLVSTRADIAVAVGRGRSAPALRGSIAERGAGSGRG